MCLQAMEKNIKKIVRKYLKRKRVGEKRLCNWRDKRVVGKRFKCWGEKNFVSGEINVLGTERVSYLNRYELFVVI